MRDRVVITYQRTRTSRMWVSQGWTWAVKIRHRVPKEIRMTWFLLLKVNSSRLKCQCLRLSGAWSELENKATYALLWTSTKLNPCRTFTITLTRETLSCDGSERAKLHAACDSELKMRDTSCASLLNPCLGIMANLANRWDRWDRLLSWLDPPPQGERLRCRSWARFRSLKRHSFADSAPMATSQHCGVRWIRFQFQAWQRAPKHDQNAICLQMSTQFKFKLIRLVTTCYSLFFQMSQVKECPGVHLWSILCLAQCLGFGRRWPHGPARTGSVWHLCLSRPSPETSRYS